MHEWDEEGEVPEPLASSPFSFYGLATDFCNMVGSVCEAAGEFAGQTAINFARAHNRRIDHIDRRDDGEKFAQDILSGLESL